MAARDSDSNMECEKQSIELLFNTISQVLSKPKAEPIKTKRILLDVAEFIPQNQRKEK